MKKLVHVMLALVLCVGLGACGQDASDESVIKVGINGEKNQVWKTVERLLAEDGIKLEVITFGDYVLPNEALADGEIDANSFQTIAYFDKFIEDHQMDLTAIAYTVLAPMGIYSAKIDDVSQLKDGASVGIPNEASNAGRALNLLQEAGLITIKEGAGILPTLKDITNNPKHLKFVELVPQELASSLEDLDIATINNGVAVQAGLYPVQDSIYYEDPNGELAVNYYNIIAVRSEDKDNVLLQKLVSAYQSEETKQAILDEYKGASIPVFEYEVKGEK